MFTKYTVVQYVPDPVADERMNIGIIAWNNEEIQSTFLKNWSRAKQFGREDIDFLLDFVVSFTKIGLRKPRSL